MVEVALEKMDSFSRTQKNMHLSIRDDIQEALKELKALRKNMEDSDCYLDFFEYLLRGRMVQKIKKLWPHKNKEVVNEGSQTHPQPTPRSTPDTRKRLREPTVSPEASAAKKPEEKRSKASNKEEKWVEVPARKNPQRKKRKKAVRTPERPKRDRTEAVPIKPRENELRLHLGWTRKARQPWWTGHHSPGN